MLGAGCGVYRTALRICRVALGFDVIVELGEFGFEDLQFVEEDSCSVLAHLVLKAVLPRSETIFSAYRHLKIERFDNCHKLHFLFELEAARPG